MGNFLEPGSPKFGKCPGIILEPRVNWKNGPEWCNLAKWSVKGMNWSHQFKETFFPETGLKEWKIPRKV